MVTASSWLLILVAAIQVVNLILSLTTIGTVRDVMRDAYRGTSVEQAADYAWVFGLGSAVLALLLAAGLVVLALLNNRGKNGARITTWVVGGILLCCTGGGLLNNAAGGMMNGNSTSGDVPSGQEIQRRLEDALPGWYGPASTLLSVIALLALLGALILLALPQANEFFRRAKQQSWEPPVPGTAYPGAAYPGAPGQPTGPGQGYGQPGHGQPGHGEPGYGQPGPGQPGHGEPGPGSGEYREPEPPAGR
ncbi:hypothetical protein [Micromonospora auratinigra]|uniref:hypothetical protein n=1 Tax=Micromonospora auratinigra TaxID=261654 RepID=UPI001E57E981|nr:hypothetical protein [Micromonospora auratinigra]